VIGFIDLDSFYVSAEIAKDPSLLGKPLIVSGGEGNKGVVLSVSYDLKKSGIRAGMPTFKAKEIFPSAIILRPDFNFYEEVSRKIKDLIFSYTPVLEQGSIDEFYLSFEGCERLYKNDFFNVVYEIRKNIKEKFKIPSSAGLSSTKCTSKILSKIAKPEGQIFVPKGKEKEFLSSFPVNLIPGIGKKLGEKLKILGIERIGDLQNCNTSLLLSVFGKEGEEIQKKALGIYEEPFKSGSIPKSIGKERTFFEEKIDLEEILKEIFWLTEEVVFRMRAFSLSARKIEVRIKYGDFEVVSSSFTFKYPQNFYGIFQKKAKEIFLSLYKRRVRVRMIGISLSNFEIYSGQRNLEIFGKDGEQIQKTIDLLKKKYGVKLISFGKI